ncbi:MAG: alanine:cation symporter family protein [Candidatus Paraimprobicoccus trichonymphae]|uniref:Alanine:cation symporter family protein n=1 Tax=Candidatus Paraimprobicoccus trichonymphae TaxID=3033793 RepID=A0AA48KY64_9FIRM|nr:MAG: alanine:cation symporter family protein [Candidatus Paraimprobicoccus trichonymphae]
MPNLELFLLSISNFLYGNIVIFLLISCGVYFTIRTGFAQIIYFFESFKLAKEKTDKNQVSSLMALMISTASRVGTGTIAGVATALVTGGPGAIFWMCVMSLISSASSIVEGTLAQLYKTVNSNGSFRGGPAYYIEKGLKNKKFGILFSILMIISFAYGFNTLQSNTISSAMSYYIPYYQNSIWPIIFGLILTIVTGFIIFGGTERIGFISSYMVPVMAIVYLAIGWFIIIKNFSSVSTVLDTVFKNAFDFRSIISGFAGSALAMGIKRGLLTTEAGMGSAPNAVATASTSHPVKSGILQLLSVGIDTMICATTGFSVLFSEVNLHGGLDGVPLVQEVLKEQIGDIGIHFITFSIYTFAYSSIISNYCLAETNFLFLKDDKKILNTFRVSCLLPILIGCVASPTAVWNFADISMALMAIVNIISMILLSNKFMICFKDYKDQKKNNSDPKFKILDYKLDNIESVWK